MDKWQELLPEGWQKFNKTEITRVYDELKAKFEALKPEAVTYEAAQELLTIQAAMNGINQHLTDEAEKVKIVESAKTAEVPELKDPAAEAKAEAEAKVKAEAEEAAKKETEAAKAKEAEEAEAKETDGEGEGDEGSTNESGEGTSESGENVEAELQELLAKAAALGYVVKTEGGDPADGGGGNEFELKQEGWREHVSDGVGRTLTQEEFDQRFLEQMTAEESFGKHTIGSLNRFDPKVASLGQGAVDYNTALILNTPAPFIEGMSSAAGYGRKPDAKVAALCGPADTIYDIPDCVDDSRKVRGWFKRLPARRGIIEFFVSLGLSDVSSLTGIAEEWTDADQDLVVEGDFATYKDCAVVACQPTQTTSLHRLYSCIKVEVLIDYGSPEIVRMYMQLISAAHARAAEERLLCTIKEKSILYSWTGELGSTVALAAGLVHLAAVSQFNGRLTGGRYMAVVVEGMLNKMESIDRVSTGHGSGNHPSFRDILGQAGIGLDTVPDACDSATSMPAPYVTAFPAPNTLDGVTSLPPVIPTAEVYGAETYPVYLITPEDGFFFELPRIDTGLVSSPELARQNARQMFMETFEGLDKNGCSPWYYIDATVCHNGDRAGFNTVFC